MASERMTDRRYKILRKQLDDLGYRQPLAIDSLPLVERLVSDLLHTTQGLKHYKELAQKSLQECSYFKNGAAPYKEDNAKLVKECNELHLRILQQKEDAEKLQKELKYQIRKLESENADLKFLSSHHLSRVKALEQESAEKSRKIIHLQSKTLQTTVATSGGKKKSLPLHHPSLEIDTPLKPGKHWKERYWSVCAQVKDPYIANMVDMCDQRICSLNREVQKLKEECLQQSEVIVRMKSQLLNRENEIERLSTMLEGGRPIAAVSKDCLFKDLEIQVAKSSDEIKRLENANQQLETKLRECVVQQHEAMTRAVKLAERNKQLQNEMHDIDRMALAVEAECSTTVKENTKKVSKIQEKLETSLMQINDLEREILELKRGNQELQADLEGSRHEKQNIQKILESTLEEKKRMTDRINNFTVVEHDLSVEIDRLTETNSLYKRRIAELETRILDLDSVDVSGRQSNGSRSPTFSKRKSTHPTKNRVESRGGITPSSYKSGMSDRNNKSLNNGRHEQDQINQKDESKEKGTLDRIQAERDYYCKAFNKVKEELSNITEHIDNNVELHRKLNEKERELIELQQLNRSISEEKLILQNRLDRLLNRNTRDCMTSPIMESPGLTMKAVLKRLERERDLAKGDVERLEEERDALRERLKIATETQVAEHARMEKTILSSEDHVRRLEAERRELLSSQGSLKATINSLEEQIIAYRDQLHASQSELSQQRALCNQIKSLQEQTDCALAEMQGHLTQSELELNNAQQRICDLERDRATLDREVASLKNERTILRGNIAQMDQEKDSLLLNIDTKTEHTAMLEQELKSKANHILNLEQSLTELQKKLDITLDENGVQEQTLRTAEREVSSLRMELDAVKHARDGTMRENRRLQDDIASLTQDSRAANRNLDLARKDVETLKHQVQEYVAEIRRIEDLLAQKECERSEMLEQFRGLSLEATVLESNNHSLETEAHEQKTQLRFAQDRITDLEQQLEMRNTLVQSYENQIADLSSHIASLETQIQQHVGERQKAEADLVALRELCVKLDTHKDGLLQQVTDNDVVKIHLEHELAQLREEQELMQDHLAKDRASINSLEELLTTSRQETMEQKLQNQELQSEVAELREKVDDLQSKLESEASELRQYQTQASEYSQQIKDLQRQITNERFERARALDESRRQKVNGTSVMQAPQHPPGIRNGRSVVYPERVAEQPIPKPQYTTLGPPSSLEPAQSRAQIHILPANWNQRTSSYTLPPIGQYLPSRRPQYMAAPPSSEWGAHNPFTSTTNQHPAKPSAEDWNSRQVLSYSNAPSSPHYTAPMDKTYLQNSLPSVHPSISAANAISTKGTYVSQAVMQQGGSQNNIAQYTFTSTGPPVSTCTAHYTLVHHDAKTETATATSTVTSHKSGGSTPPSEANK